MPNPTRTEFLRVLLLAVAFAVAHTQSPLFYQNQSQYLLHGLAAGGHGNLADDWLANTKDPTPVFSLGVQLAYRAAGLAAIQAIYFLMLVGYFLAVWWLVRGVVSNPPSVFRFAALFTTVHAAILRWLSVQATGVDYPWYLQAGVAGQYTLGPGLQPSAFGLLLVLGLAAFANSRPVFAGVLGAIAAVLHPTYLLPAGLLTGGYIVALAMDRQWRQAVSVGVVSLVIVAPVVAYTLITFPPSSAESFREAQRILAHTRIPHHSLVNRWFDGVALLQILWAGVGLVLLRKSPLFRPLILAASGAVILTLAQAATENPTFALLFPWRLSVLLVPVSTAIICAKLTTRVPGGRITTILFAGLLVGSVAGGIAVMVLGLGYRMNEQERPALEFVRASATPNDVYLIPVRIPAVGSGPRGAASTTFTSPPRAKPGVKLVPIDLQRFRLYAGAAVFADFKSVPYADTEVLEWYRRVRLAEAWYELSDWDAAGVRDQLRAEGVTHVLIPRHQTIRAGFLDELYVDEAYGVYRVR